MLSSFAPKETNNGTPYNLPIFLDNEVALASARLFLWFAILNFSAGFSDFFAKIIVGVSGVTVVFW